MLTQHIFTTDYDSMDNINLDDDITKKSKCCDMFDSENKCCFCLPIWTAHRIQNIFRSVLNR